MSEFRYEGRDFFLNDEKFTVLSGGIHYFRVHPGLWEDRLRKLKACGLNTVETYVAWNLHERRQGEFDFSGRLDLARFVKLAAELELKVIVRPGPFICAELDFGGLPSWLLTYPELTVRNSNEQYLEFVESYLKRLFEKLKPHLITNGGNIIMLQIENEYGSFGNDKDYLKALLNIYKKYDMDALLFTADGIEDYMLVNGTLDDILITLNFGSNPKRALSQLDKHRPNNPFVCMEYWNGWFDHWHEHHHTRSADDAAAVFAEMLELGGSVNFYMYHGGTNFGFINGANHEDGYQPTITSYDYDAPLSECGDMTEKYYKVKNVILDKYGDKDGNLAKLEVKNSTKMDYGCVDFEEVANLFDCLPASEFSTVPLTMEKMGQDFGYILYRTTTDIPVVNLPLIIEDVRDRAHIYINGELKGIIERSHRQDEIIINNPMGEILKIDILVENMGRVNFGARIMDEKGITKRVRIGNMTLFGWDIYPLFLEKLPEVYQRNNNYSFNTPVFARGYFEAAEIGDTFLYLDGLKKGVAYVNGFNLGRYYNDAGPQKSLYVPSPIIKTGKNEIVVFETDGIIAPKVSLKSFPTLG